jgi:hypothetical protein
VVFSPEEPMKPAQYEVPPPGRRAVPGSLIWVPASAGMLLCQYVLGELIAQGRKDGVQGAPQFPRPL